MTTVERDTIGPLSIYKTLLPNSRAYIKITPSTAQEQTVDPRKRTAIARRYIHKHVADAVR
jgi:hypothetical protein